MWQYFSSSKFSILAAHILLYIYIKTFYVVNFMISIKEHIIYIYLFILYLWLMASGE